MRCAYPSYILKGKLVTKRVDEFVYSIVGAKWESISGIVARVLSASGLDLPAEDIPVVVNSVDALVSDGRFEAQGDVQDWRQSKVRRARKWSETVPPSKIIVPLNLDGLESPSVITCDDSFEIVFSNDNILFIEFDTVPGEIDWFESFDKVLCERLPNYADTAIAIRKATNEDCREHRVPRWIQEPEIPRCCGKPMFFIGQFDDYTLAKEGSPDAEVWWHDYASFYIFTCSRCLNVKAIGQQH
jgi:hypothetical protein